MTMEEKKKKIRELLDKYLAEYIPMQEVIHACSQLSKNLDDKDKTTENIHEMMDYLMQPDKEFVLLQTLNIKSIINNQVRLCMAEVVKVIDAPTTSDSGGGEST